MVPVTWLSPFRMKSSLLGKYLRIVVIVKQKQQQNYKTNRNTERKARIYQIHK